MKCEQTVATVQDVSGSRGWGGAQRREEQGAGPGRKEGPFETGWASVCV